MNTRELQELQAQYDVRFWEKNDSRLEKIRHITLHVGKLLGKLSAYCEAEEHGKSISPEQIRKEVIPDLLLHALQLSNLLSVKLDEAYLDRLERNKVRLHSNKGISPS